MTVREIYALATKIKEHLNRDSIAKVYIPDPVIGCGISWLWLLPPDHPWNAVGLCPKHDELFTTAEKSAREVQKWWIIEAWKASPTWELKLLFVLTLPAVMSWTAARYRQRKIS